MANVGQGSIALKYPAAQGAESSALSLEHTTLPLSALASNAGVLLLQPGSSQLDNQNNCLQQLFLRLREVYHHADIAPELRSRRYIAPSGLVMSPNQCLTTVLDTRRVCAYAQGIDQALADMFAAGRSSLHLAYPACGPLAPLLLPLLAHYQHSGLYTPQQLQVSLIDAQAGAVASLETMVQALNLAPYIHRIDCADACEWRADRPIDVLVLESMQHGLSREAHVAIARHCVGMLAPQGLMIPQDICISASLNHGQREFVEQWDGRSDPRALRDAQLGDALFTPPCAPPQSDILAQRTGLGEVLRLNLASLRDWPCEQLDEHTQLLRCAALKVPPMAVDDHDQLLLLSSRIRTYGDIWINEYDSGISHPLPQLKLFFNPRRAHMGDGEMDVFSGDILRFYYALKGLPGFLVTLEQPGHG